MDFTSIITSSDANHWYAQTSGTYNWLNGIIHDGNNTFITVGGMV